MTDGGDTWRFFSRPWLAALALSWTVGVIDAYSYAEYGVFTSNQAGNLVLLGTDLPHDPEHAALAGLSLFGAAVGVAAATLLQRSLRGQRWRQMAVPLGLMVCLMLLTMLMRQVLDSPPQVLVPLTSTALAGLATAVYRTPAIQGWITANTGAVLTTVHTAFQTSAERRSATKPVLPAIMITTGFLAGALLWGSGVFGTTDPTLTALAPTVVALALALADDRRARNGGESAGSAE